MKEEEEPTYEADDDFQVTWDAKLNEPAWSSRAVHALCPVRHAQDSLTSSSLRCTSLLLCFTLPCAPPRLVMPPRAESACRV